MSAAKTLLKREIEAEFARIEKEDQRTVGQKGQTAEKTGKLRQLLPTKRHGIKKELRKLKRLRQGQAHSRSNNWSYHKLESTDDKLAASSNDIVAANLAALERLSSAKVASDWTRSIVDNAEKTRHRLTKADRAKAREILSAKRKSPGDKGSVFTDEDFEKFKKAYFINSKVESPQDEDD